ncbi:MAG: translation initiation factor IF-2 N-terminal domain-containing protein, partial [Eubacteriales bacterium]|nr:translation initiation factor IF-2 N-terminal domain-containing protein [Eubacteriales bacterium]
MSKMRVYEIARELNRDKKDIMNFLTGKGVEVKSHMTELNEDQIALVRKNITAGPAPVKVQKPAEDKQASDGADRPKKKNISRVFRGQNSRTGIQKPAGMRSNTEHQPAKPARSAKPAAEQQAAKPAQAAAPVKTAAEQQAAKPVQNSAPAVEQTKSAAPAETAKPAQAVAPVKPAAEQQTAGPAARPAQNNNRPAQSGNSQRNGENRENNRQGGYNRDGQRNYGDRDNRQGGYKRDGQRNYGD